MSEENNVPKKTSPWIVLVLIVVFAGAIAGYLLLKPGTEGGKTGGKPEILEYTDKKYDYSFQYPSYWEVQEAPPGYDIGEARVLLQGPSGSSVVALISDVEKSMSKDEFNSNPDNGDVRGRKGDSPQRSEHPVLHLDPQPCGYNCTDGRRRNSCGALWEEAHDFLPGVQFSEYRGGRGASDNQPYSELFPPPGRKAARVRVALVASGFSLRS
jgi:hypothetical protein